MYLLYVIGLSLMGPSVALALLFYFSHRDNEIIRKHKEQKRLAQIYKQQEQQNLREDAIIHQKYKEDKIRSEFLQKRKRIVDQIRKNNTGM